jgi:hypothetical protein
MLYREYRSWIQQAVSATWGLHQRCAGEITETLTTEEVAAMADFFNRAFPRTEAMLAEAQQLPR